MLVVVSGMLTLGLTSGRVAFAASAKEVSLPPVSEGAWLHDVRWLAVQHNGRLKPLDSLAWETLKLISGRSRLGHQDPVATVLAIMAQPELWQAAPLVWVPFIPLREALGMDRRTAHISYNDLMATRRLMRMLPAIVEKQQRDEKLSMLEQETMDVFDRFVALSTLCKQQLALIPPPSPTDRVWGSLPEPTGYSAEQDAAVRGAWTSFMAAVREGRPQAIEPAAQQLASVLRAVNPAAYPPTWRLHLEVWYNVLAPFRIATAVYLLACLILLAGLVSVKTGTRRLGMLMLAVGFAFHAAGILTRVVLGGRPPVSNFYETMLWLPFVAVSLALILERIYRVSVAGLAASVLAAIMLALADRVPLDSSISPVVAVLHSNLWLTVHVLTIVASYGALALATVFAHLEAVFHLLRRAHRPAPVLLNTLLYRVIQVGVVLLAAGIMLGAVWANASWGRYWGWDPKETWALITLLWFLAVLHGRSAGWLEGAGMALATIGGFFLLLMTYYGVSFYLVGLHSYAGGHAKPLPALLVGYL
ncbi:MAG: cytochrome c biogenesis protein CcsA, partial [Candidatus Omnitrophica bacterium]|nr:cytochrome c biogenesis protein CcsA [Candidatus Omnitrophota bacterium]